MGFSPLTLCYLFVLCYVSSLALGADSRVESLFPREVVVSDVLDATLDYCIVLSPCDVFVVVLRMRMNVRLRPQCECMLVSPPM
jgi:hypothetical protein